MTCNGFAFGFQLVFGMGLGLFFLAVIGLLLLSTFDRTS